MNEDPKCLRPYPEDLPYDNSYSVKDGECVRMDDKWYRIKIVPNDGKALEWRPEWKDFKFKQEMKSAG